MITVKELIAAQDKSISKLARDIGINPFTLRRILLGEGKVKEITANKICKYFGVDIKEVKEFQVLYNLGTSNKEKPRKKKTSPKVKKKTKERKIVVTKQYPCFNHNCPLCKNDLCNSDIVNADIAGCASKGIHKEKNKAKNKLIHPKNGKHGITVVKNARKARKENSSAVQV